MKNVKFHFYKGKSFISKIIKWRTFSIYSHVSIEIDGDVWEAWEGSSASGVVKSSNPSYYHTPLTEFDTIIVPMKNVKEWKTFLDLQIGKKYDYKAIFSFLRNRNKQDNSKWFCSELAHTYFDFEVKNYKYDRLVSPQTLKDMIEHYLYGLEQPKVA